MATSSFSSMDSQLELGVDGLMPRQHRPSDMVSHDGFYPIGLTFARRLQQSVSRWAPVSVDEFSDSEVETICVTASRQERLGIVLMQMDNGDISVSDFQGVAGIFQQALDQYQQKNGSINLAVESINAQIVRRHCTKCD